MRRVHKKGVACQFQNMYLNGTSIQVLLRKGEALIDRYLDTTTPPWVKVTISLKVH